MHGGSNHPIFLDCEYNQHDHNAHLSFHGLAIRILSGYGTDQTFPTIEVHQHIDELDKSYPHFHRLGLSSMCAGGFQ
jgi:hypothetical protein